MCFGKTSVLVFMFLGVAVAHPHHASSSLEEEQATDAPSTTSTARPSRTAAGACGNVWHDKCATSFMNFELPQVIAEVTNQVHLFDLLWGCYPAHFKCNGRKECMDGSDETHCKSEEAWAEATHEQEAEQRSFESAGAKSRAESTSEEQSQESSEEQSKETEEESAESSEE